MVYYWRGNESRYTSIHYLAKDDAHVLAWCKTNPARPFQPIDHQAGLLELLLKAQGVINKLKEFDCLINNAPYSWST